MCGISCSVERPPQNRQLDELLVVRKTQESENFIQNVRRFHSNMEIKFTCVNM